jgi:hypothetical protein
MSLLCRFIHKIVLDGTGYVQFRNPSGAGGLYYCFNAVMTHVSCFVAAALYSTYSTGIAPHGERYSGSASNCTGANVTNPTATLLVTDYPGKIDALTLFTAIATLSTVWAIAFASLILTMNREYIGSFLSLQTGHAFSRSNFLDHAGNDARRAEIFYRNERHWRSIRDLVRAWTLGAYAAWLQLSPVWLTDALRTLIPDDFMPAPVVQQLHAQAPGGRRRSILNLSALQRMSVAFADSGSAAAQNSDSDSAAEA